MRSNQKNENIGRISLCRRWSGLGQGARKRDPTGNPRILAESLSVAGGQGERKRDPTGNPRTSAGSLSVAGGGGWVGVREREIRPETHAFRLDLSLSQEVEVESVGSFFPSLNLSLSPGVRLG